MDGYQTLLSALSSWKRIVRVRNDDVFGVGLF